MSGDKTWQHFKTYFTMAHQELCKFQKTSQCAGYHGANNTIIHTSDGRSDLHQETVNSISNLATDTAENCTTIAILADTNSNISDELININDKLVKSLESNKYLSSKL